MKNKWFYHKSLQEGVTNEVDIPRTEEKHVIETNDVDSQGDLQRQKTVKFGSTTQVAEFDSTDVERPPLSIETRRSKRFIGLSVQAEKSQAINRLTGMS